MFDGSDDAQSTPQDAKPEACARPHALDQPPEFWGKWASEHAHLGAKRFLNAQLTTWLFARKVFDPTLMTDLPKALRDVLKDSFRWHPNDLFTVTQSLPSSDGSEKILVRTTDGKYAECVLMPSPNRVTVCLSSQVGCRMACSFCQTGKMGFTRNLSRGEILAQLLIAEDRLIQRARLGTAPSPTDGPSPRTKVTNVVFMGMGEPLDNLEAVMGACEIMIDPKALGLSRHRVTVSTSGLVPEIKTLGQRVPVSLAISLHAAQDDLRSRMMPINKRWNLAALKEALLEYPVQTRHGITFEYVLIDGVNDSLTHAKQLVRFVHGLKAKVNLIPMNPHPGSSMKAPSPETIRAFQSYLAERSIAAPVRYSRGQDVSGACGQLAAKKAEELSLPPLVVARARRREQMQGSVATPVPSVP
jgi:23S rRNA (adenine2503-C2)-methyltransferase